MTFPRAGAAAPAPTSAPSYSPLLHPSCEGRIPGPPVAQVQCPPSNQEDKSGFFFGSCLLILLSLPQKPPGFLLSEFSLIPDPSGNRRAKYRQKESGVLIPHAPPQPQGLLAPCPPPESSPPPQRAPRTNPFPGICMSVSRMPHLTSSFMSGGCQPCWVPKEGPKATSGPCGQNMTIDYNVCCRCGKKRGHVSATPGLQPAKKRFASCTDPCPHSRDAVTRA